MGWTANSVFPFAFSVVILRLAKHVSFHLHCFFGGDTSSGTYLRILQLHLHMLVHGCLDGSWLLSCQSALSPLSIRPLSLQTSHAFYVATSQGHAHSV